MAFRSRPHHVIRDSPAHNLFLSLNQDLIQRPHGDVFSRYINISFSERGGSRNPLRHATMRQRVRDVINIAKSFSPYLRLHMYDITYNVVGNVNERFRRYHTRIMLLFVVDREF